MTTTARRLELTLLNEPFVVTRLPASAPVPEWAMGGSFSSVTRTEEELSVVCELSRLPSDLHPPTAWRVLKVHGPFVLSEIGVLCSLALPLAESRLSLFVISTFDTDYLLVAAETLSASLEALELAGHRIHRSDQR